jgi:myo-inositol-1(or 4)-monophosphatase
MTTQDLQKIQDYLIPKIKQLGQYAIQEQTLIQGDLKKDGSLVTKIDKHIELELTNHILQKSPTSQFINEEGTSNPNQSTNSELTWIIDPIDGTRNYVHQLPIFCISVALAIQEEIQLAIIHIPTLKETYTAIKSQGSYLNQKAIHVTQDPSPLKPICFDQSYLKPNNPYLQAIINKIPNPKRITGSACFNLCLVAKGAAITANHNNTKIWDLAAGKLIVEEAGGTVTYTNGQTVNIHQIQAPFIASNNSQNHHQLIHILN